MIQSLLVTIRTIVFTQRNGKSLEGFEQKGGFNTIPLAAMMRIDFKRQE